LMSRAEPVERCESSNVQHPCADVRKEKSTATVTARLWSVL
jgi:hypothetical protein